MTPYDQIHEVVELGCAEPRALTELISGEPKVFPVGMGAATREVVINPEWLALEGKPHYVLAVSPGAFDAIQVGPPPSTP